MRHRTDRDLDTDVLTDAIPPITPTQAAAAARTVAALATDTGEARQVLAALGILDRLGRAA